jgi:Mn-dependent DtxR family transcriptional regulator
MPDYTQKQGQYLAFIYNYTKINRRAPAEADIQRFFNVTPPTVHQMILALEKSGFVSREPGKARTLKVLLAPDQIPYLEGHRMSRR